jgi:NAD(P)H-dependent flavin oxidoreductase YrpB (nitropropane dioxygenase family)
VITDMLTGRYARVLRNAITDALGGATGADIEALPFPAQYLVNADVFAHAIEHEDAEHLPLWASQSIGRVHDLPWAADVVSDTVRQAFDLVTGGLARSVTLS